MRTKNLMVIVAQATLFAAFAARAGIEVAQDRADALYHAGEEAVFTVSVKDGSGELVRTGTAAWSLDNFGTVKLGAGGDAVLARHDEIHDDDVRSELQGLPDGIRCWASGPNCRAAFKTFG